jgi:chromosome partitioning protein
MKTIAFFNNKSGVGKTSLAYHLAWMYADIGIKVIAADLDPQATLTSMFLDEDRLLALWPDIDHSQTVLSAVAPLLKGIGDISTPHVEPIDDNIGLIVGDLGLSSFEDELSAQWPKFLDGDERAFRVISAFSRMLVKAAIHRDTDLVLIDLGPNLGAINRAALIAADYIVIPLAPDIFSLQALRNLGPALRRWRQGWSARLMANPEPTLDLPKTGMNPVGYVILQHAVRLDRPVQAYGRWMERIPRTYVEAILGETSVPVAPLATHEHCLAMLKNYRSLMPMAMEAHKPMFFLKPADGAIGGHMAAVQNCYQDFILLARSIAERCEIALP